MINMQLEHIYSYKLECLLENKVVFIRFITHGLLSVGYKIFDINHRHLDAIFLEIPFYITESTLWKICYYSGAFRFFQGKIHKFLL